ncbi:MAG: hypothetical protein EA402_01505 [Planctomycetota bacterium]|nr:MAG: hypothetical protein EA402_01505 [Planctomycetota bacterium]
MSRSKRVVLLGLLLLVVLAGIAALMAPGILRSMKAAELAQAEPNQVDRIASEYLERVRLQGHFIDQFLRDHQDAPLTTRLRLVELAYRQSEGRVARFDALMMMLADPALPAQERAQILGLAASIYSPSLHRGSPVPRAVVGWASPSDRADAGQRAQALAAIQLLVRLEERSELRVDETLAELANNPATDSRLLTAAIEGLASVTSSGNVGYAMNLLLGPNADAASENQKLVDVIYTSVRAVHIPSIMRLWDSPNERVSALGYRAIGGPNVAIAENDAQTRENLGNRVAGLLTPELLRDSPVRFNGLLDAVMSLRLTGTRDQLIRLAPHMETETVNKAGTALASFIRDPSGNETQMAINEDTLERIASAISDSSRRPLGLAALQQLRAGASTFHLRSALEAAVAHGEAPGAMSAIHHVVRELYRRGDIIESLGEDVARWQAFMAEDRPRFEYFHAAVAWHQENQHRVRVSDADTIPKNRARAEEVQPELQRWIEDPRTPIPLGLSQSQVERFHHTVNTFKRNLIHSDVRR